METIKDGIISELGISRIYLNDFCSENIIDTSSRSAFNSSLQIALSRLESERETLKKKIAENKPESTKGKNSVTTWEDYDSLDYIHSNKKTNRNKYPTKLLTLDKSIRYIKTMLLYVKDHTGKETTPTKENENNVPGLMQFEKTKEIIKRKQDTKPKDKHIFIDTFIEKSKLIIFNNQKDISQNCNVSKTWISNHFTLEFLETLFDEMNREFNEIVKRESKRNLYESYEDENLNEIFQQNFAYIKKMLEDREERAKYNKSRNELKKEISKKT